MLESLFQNYKKLGYKYVQQNNEWNTYNLCLLIGTCLIIVKIRLYIRFLLPLLMENITDGSSILNLIEN